MKRRRENMVRKNHFIHPYQNEMLAEIFDKSGINESEIIRTAIDFYAENHFNALYSEFKNQSAA